MREPVQIPGPTGLRRHDARESRPVEVDERGVVDDHRRVEDAARAERPVVSATATRRAASRRCGRCRRRRARTSTPAARRAATSARLLVGRSAAAGKDELPRAPRRRPHGECGADAAAPACNDVGRVGPEEGQRRRRGGWIGDIGIVDGHDELADVPRLRERAQSPARAGRSEAPQSAAAAAIPPRCPWSVCVQRVAKRSAGRSRRANRSAPRSTTGCG